MSFSLIAAVGEKNELGAKNALLWDLKEDLKYFQGVTMGHPVVMGHRTFTSLPLMLEGRKHFVVTLEPEVLEVEVEGKRFKGEPKDRPEVEAVTDLYKFIDKYQDSEEEIFVIGGGMLYTEMLDYCDKLYLTEIHATFDNADVYFPEFDKSKYTREVVKEGKDEKHDLSYSFVVYTKN